MTEILLSIIAGLVLFLFAVSSLSDTIRDVLGDKAKTWLLRFTSNVPSSILTGAVATTLLDSSSAVIIIAIIFVNAGLLLLFRKFVQVVAYVSGHAPVERALANAHMLFNIGGVLVFVWFLPLFERFFERLLPD